MKRLWILCAALLALLMPLPASAQVDRATLTGTGCAVSRDGHALPRLRRLDRGALTCRTTSDANEIVFGARRHCHNSRET